MAEPPKVCVPTPPHVLFSATITAGPNGKPEVKDTTKSAPAAVVEPTPEGPTVTPRAWHSPKVKLFLEQLQKERREVFALYCKAKADCESGADGNIKINGYYELLGGYDKALSSLNGPLPKEEDLKKQGISFPWTTSAKSESTDIYGIKTVTESSITIPDVVSYMISQAQGDIHFAGDRLEMATRMESELRLDDLKDMQKQPKSAPTPPKVQTPTVRVGGR